MIDNDLFQEKRDLVTGLKSRTIAGRPNWNKVFTQIREQRKGRITVFYCGKQIFLTYINSIPLKFTSMQVIPFWPRLCGKNVTSSNSNFIKKFFDFGAILAMSDCSSHIITRVC